VAVLVGGLDAREAASLEDLQKLRRQAHQARIRDAHQVLSCPRREDRAAVGIAG
jgi:hypothetical protein